MSKRKKTDISYKPVGIKSDDYYWRNSWRATFQSRSTTQESRYPCLRVKKFPERDTLCIGEYKTRKAFREMPGLGDPVWVTRSGRPGLVTPFHYDYRLRRKDRLFNPKPPGQGILLHWAITHKGFSPKGCQWHKSEGV